MKILFVQWSEFGKEDITEAFTNMGHEVIPFNFPVFMSYEVSQTLIDFNKTLDSVKPDLVFSSNFSPNVSALCYTHSIPYAAWVYDSPLLNTFSATLANPTNFCFMFDSEDYEIIKNNGINTIYYLPLAANVHRTDKMIPNKTIHQKLDSDISFVGRFYTEEKNEFENAKNVNEYTKGYLDALMDAQQLISGVSFVEPLIKGPILDELLRVVPHEPLPNYSMTDSYLFSRYYIEREITRKERKKLLQSVSENFTTKLYTPKPTPDMPNIINMGPINPYTELPYVFKCSKINLNITLRSIHAGIPLRAIEIMGSGGFLISNFQKDYLMYFEPDKDFVYYEDERDLLDKCAFYLKHDTARNKIAISGYNKIKEFFTYDVMLKNILDTIFS